MKRMMLIIKILLFFALLFVLYLAGVILYAQFTQYKPEVSSAAAIQGRSDEQVGRDTLTVYTWNLGYGGIGKDADFFYDGGKMVRSPEEKVEQNIKGIIAEMETWHDADFILLQEVDEIAKRSWKIPEREMITERLSGQFPVAVFAKNYDVRFVPMPLDRPMGKVISGILSLSRYQQSEAVRYAYPANFPWPKGLFFLNRCFLLQRYPYKGKELVVVNTHNSAFDGGVLKKQEMDFLKKYLLEEYAKGNYVIMGGDWNQVPPGYAGNARAEYEETPVPAHYPAKDWKWVADLSHRSNRKVDTPYIKGVTYTTILDFFLVSPNVEVLKVEGKELNFQYTDHEPVKIQVRLL